MDWKDLLTAFGLVLVIEGIMPFLSPLAWRRTLEAVAQLDTRRLRLVGLASMAAGLVILYFARS
ncbi:MAG TPA: DUF2065 domain-containing protein [Gammaproteobacteria bacterium]|nr:DUF2065 domain-containing protein [Gammaproteobacteria bacterium]